ncbi:reverse transcriptase domain-containing protein [Tanacetum coccineum]|uniref:Reverse transcriptase domain-containing protein n=1 Tax=Tanacetum coccineum TaxID=301880 RepID=A0ABQ5IPR3_9ASTR
MRTRSQPRNHNRQQQAPPAVVEPFNLEEPFDNPPLVPMADNRTMAKLLQAPIEGYEDAIVIPEINTNFELKHGLINLVQNKQFFGHDKEDPHAHIRYFNKITSTMRFSDVPSTSIKLMLFPFSLEGSARIWLEKEPPRSILTWDDLVSKFINQFFPPSKTTNLQNEITRFQQRFDESNEVLATLMLLMLRGAVPKRNGSFEYGAPGYFKRDCPKLKNKDGGNGNAQGWVYAIGNAKKNGNASRNPDSNVITTQRRSQTPQLWPINRTKAECSKHTTEGVQGFIVIPEINTNLELKQITSTMRFPDVPSTSIKLMLFPFSLEVSELKNMMKTMLIDKQKAQAPVPVKVVEQSCVTCGGAHSYRNCPATDGNVIEATIQEYVSHAAAATVNQRKYKFLDLRLLANKIKSDHLVFLRFQTIKIVLSDQGD